MRILLSNDDGFDSVGIRALFKVFSREHEVYIVAPDQERSGYSRAITLNKEITCTKVEDRIYKVGGTPFDCVKLALSGVLDLPSFDLVITGINNGYNLGCDVWLSGTVGAAHAGLNLTKYAPIALSTLGNDPKNCQDAAEYIRSNLDSFLFRNEINTVLNVNIPDLKAEQIKGLRLAVLGARKPEYKFSKSEHGFLLGEPNEEIHASGTDFELIKQGFITLTPLKMSISSSSLNKEYEQKLSVILSESYV